MLPSDDVQPNHLQSIKQFVKSFFQYEVNKALPLFTCADSHHKEAFFYKANHEIEAALKKLETGKILGSLCSWFWVNHWSWGYIYAFIRMGKLSL